jgi:hypothetical protein
MEILIGREVSGGLNIRVNQKYNRVSREHAKVFFEKGELYIQDLNSVNGTFVNGHQIFKSKIKISDRVLLGDSNIDTGYILDVNKLTKEIEETERYRKIDYSKEFLLVKDVYGNCKKEIYKKKKRVQLQAKLPVIIISLLIFLVVFIGYKMGWLEAHEKLISPVSGIITTIVALFVLFVEIKVDMEDSIDLIHKKYEDQYVCPRCLKRLDIEAPWRKYKKDGKCPHNCGAKY